MRAPRLATISTRIRTPWCGNIAGSEIESFFKTAWWWAATDSVSPRPAQGTHFKIVQSGITVIEDDVEIQSLTSIDRATVGETRVKRGAKIDSLVQVGHACVVGEDNIICAQTGLAGGSVLEKNVLLAGQVGISGHLTIHDNAVIYAQSGIGGDVAEGAVMSGSPAFEAREWLRAITAFPKLPDLLKTVRQLEKRLDRLEGAASTSQ